MAFLSNISRKSRKRIIIIVSVVAVLLIAGGVAASFILKPSDSNPVASDNSQPTGENPFEPSVSSLVAKTIVAANEAVSKSESVEDGVAVYQKAIEGTDSSSEKSALLMKQAEFLSARNDNQSAIKATLQAQEVGGETLEKTTMLAVLYELEGDNSNAAIYYRKAASQLLQMPSDETLADLKAEAAYYQDKANQLEAQK